MPALWSQLAQSGITLVDMQTSGRLGALRRFSQLRHYARAELAEQARWIGSGMEID